jgi:MFS family permease
MWITGFLLHEMAFGLLSVFLPLYIMTLPGLGGLNLIYFGIMIAVANFAAVPFSFLWGYLSDKTRHYRIYILLSFATMALFLYLFSLTTNIILLVTIYAATAIFHVAHEAPKNILISEYYARPEWEGSFATYEALTELSGLIGLLLGFILSSVGFNNVQLILLTSLLNLAAFVTAFLTVNDPLFVFERQLVAVERAFNFAQRGVLLASKAIDGLEVKEKLRNESASIFCVGLLVFSLATSMMFTPLPVFFSQPPLNIHQTLVFGIFVFNSLGTFFGYTLVRRRAENLNGKSVVQRANLARGALTLVLISAVTWVSVLTLTLSVLALVAMGVVYAFFLISTISLSMELIPQGKAGLFNALIGLGGAVGCLSGSYMAKSFGFPILFGAASIGFFISFIAFKTYTR